MDAPHPHRGLRGCGPLAEGNRPEVRRGGGEPADGILMPATVLIDTSHSQRMQRLHQRRPQSGHRQGQVGTHPPREAGGPEETVVPGAAGHAGHVRGRRALDQVGRSRIEVRRHRGTTDP
jgi:hypothetical protein